MKNPILKKSVETIIAENKLYLPLLSHCSEGLILFHKDKHSLLWLNDTAFSILDLLHDKRYEDIGQIFEPCELKQLMEKSNAMVQIKDLSVDCHCNVVGSYAWIFLKEAEKTEAFDTLTEKLLTLNKELVSVFDRYGDETLMLMDGEGYIEFAGETAARASGVSPDFFIGKNVYDMEKQRVFYPSVCVRVLDTKQPQVVIQTTQTGEERVSLGAPIFNEDNEIEKVVTITRDYSSQMKISKLIAELAEIDPPKNSTEEKENEAIVTCNHTMFEIKTLVKMIAATKATVLITGETGTGKEVIARYVYHLSDRKKKPFVKVNCGTIPHSIVESELFGYEEGAFTGASKGGKIGLIEAANGGTLFLDEISELPMEQQVKLLHVIQERMLIRVGGTTPVDLDIRIIAATNKNLEEQVRLGNFREDLYYRLNLIPINIPPLRERREDIPLLTRHFFNQFRLQYDKDMQISNQAIMALEKYSWPGNIRQLENTIERLILTTPKHTIAIGDLPEMVFNGKSNGILNVNRLIPLEAAIEELEKEMLRMALDEYGTTTKAAEVLGVNQSTVSRKIAKYRLKEKDSK